MFLQMFPRSCNFHFPSPIAATWRIKARLSDSRSRKMSVMVWRNMGIWSCQELKKRGRFEWMQRERYSPKLVIVRIGWSITILFHYWPSNICNFLRCCKKEIELKREKEIEGTRYRVYKTTGLEIECLVILYGPHTHFNVYMYYVLYMK